MGQKNPYPCCGGNAPVVVPPLGPPLRILFDDINNAPVLDYNNLDQWNIAFNLPADGSPFTAIAIVGNELQLFGGSGITFRNQADMFDSNASIIHVIDEASCVIAVASFTFVSSLILETVILPAVLSCGTQAFQICAALINVEMPLCATLGATVGDNGVFEDTVGNVISLTVPTALATCNAGNPDGDIQFLEANNTATINYV